MPKKFTKEEFVAIANEVHNGKYNYENSVYINSMSSIIINCPKHGDFKQRANAHILGHKCPKCGRFSMAVKKRRGVSFIDAAMKKHGNKYDYSKVVYENNRSRVIIGCPIHGDFVQVASDHQQGNGCQTCGKNKRSLFYNGKDSISKHILYNTWTNVKGRCRDPKNQSYERYGAKGINVSDEFFNSFDVFKDYVMGLPNYDKKASDKWSLDRINTKGNYEKGNLRWADKFTQARNKNVFAKSGYEGIRILDGRIYVTVSVALGFADTMEEGIAMRNTYIEEHDLPCRVQTFSP